MLAVPHVPNISNATIILSKLRRHLKTRHLNFTSKDSEYFKQPAI